MLLAVGAVEEGETLLHLRLRRLRLLEVLHLQGVLHLRPLLEWGVFVHCYWQNWQILPSISGRGLFARLVGGLQSFGRW